MSHAAFSWAALFSEATIGTRLVMFAMASHASDDESYCWCSVKTIAREAKLSERQTQRCIRELIEMGEIVYIGKYTYPNGIVTNKYQLLKAHKWIKEQIEAKQNRGDNKSPGGVTSATSGGDIRDTGGVTSMSPNPNNTIHNTKEESGKAASPQPPQSIDLKRPKRKEPKPLSEHEQKFLDAWRAAYLQERNVEYRKGGLDYRERAAITRLLNSTDKPIEELIEWAKAAWSNSGKIFECKGSLTILGFETRFYDIMGKVTINQFSPPPAATHKRFADMTEEEKEIAGGLKRKDGTWDLPVGWKE